MDVGRVLDDVVEQPGRDGHDVEPKVGQDVGDADRVHEIGFPGTADLTLVLAGGEVVGPPKQIDIGVWRVGADPRDKVFEPDHEYRCLTTWGLVGTDGHRAVGS